PWSSCSPTGGNDAAGRRSRGRHRPEDAEWATAASAFLAERAYVLVRLPSLSFASFAVLRGGVAGLLIDARLMAAGSAAFIGQLQRGRPRLRVVTVGAAGAAEGVASHLAWPFGRDELEKVFEM